MSEENLDALKSFYERWAAGDWSDASIFDPYAVGVFPDPTPRAHYGLNAMADYMRRFLESWDDMRMEGTDYREAGDSFVVRVHRAATGRGSGVQLEVFALLFTPPRKAPPKGGVFRSRKPCRRQDSNLRHADYDSAALTS
jgi:SnoaL-like protein